MRGFRFLMNKARAEQRNQQLSAARLMYVCMYVCMYTYHVAAAPIRQLFRKDAWTWTSNL